MGPKRSSSLSRKKGKSLVPPPPPPVLHRIDTLDDFRARVEEHAGSVLLAIVTPTCTTCTDTIVPFMEKLNTERPPLLQSTTLAVLYAMDTTRELCQALQIMTVPAFRAYSYGQLVESFAGSNTNKATLIAKLAAQAAQEEAIRLAELAKANSEAAAATATAAPAA